MAKPKVSIIFGTVDRVSCVENLMRSITQYTPPIDYQVIIVDGSDQGSAWVSACKYPHTECFGVSRSLGFAKAYNSGAQIATGDYLVWLNDDCLVTPRWLERTVAFMVSHPNVGIGGLRFNEGLRVCVEQRIYNRYYANFGCIPMKLWKILGGFDGRFHSYGADTDLSFRTLSRGLAVMPIPRVAVTHLRVQDALRHVMSKERSNGIRIFNTLWAKRRHLLGTLA